MNIPALIFLAIWLVPSHIIYFCGGIRYYSSVFFWPVWLFFLTAATITVFCTSGAPGVRNYYRYLSGGI